MEKLDRIDRKMLLRLDTDSRRSLSELSRELRLGRDLVAYRLRRFTESGLISGTRAIINPGALGYTVFKTYLKLKNRPAELRRLVGRVKAHESTLCYAATDGSWDLIFNMVFPTAHEFATAQEILLAPFHDLVLAREVAVVLHQRTYPRKFLSERDQGASTIWEIGAPREAVLLDRVDRELLRLLTTDARMNIVDLAERTKSTPVIIRRHIEQLEETQVVIGYRIDLDRRKLGMTMFKGQIAFRSDASVKLGAFRNFADRHSAIMSYMEQLGGCRVECNIIANSFDDGVAVMEELRTKFVHEIESTTLLVVREEEFCFLRKIGGDEAVMVEAAA